MKFISATLSFVTNLVAVSYYTVFSRFFRVKVYNNIGELVYDYGGKKDTGSDYT
jgi:hypothetical protein